MKGMMGGMAGLMKQANQTLTGILVLALSLPKKSGFQTKLVQAEQKIFSSAALGSK